MDNLSRTARLVHCLAGQEASGLGFHVIEPTHIFLGLCKGATLTPGFLREFTDLVAGLGPSREELVERFGQIGSLFQYRSLNPNTVHSEFAGFLGPGLFAKSPSLSEQVFSVDAECLKLFRKAARLAAESGSHETEPVHLLWALLTGTSLVSSFLSEIEVDIKALQEECQRAARDLHATEALAIPLLPREKEMLALAQALVRMDRTAVVLLGEEGVGRTCLVQAFAIALSQGDLPPGLLKHLDGKRVVQAEPGQELALQPAEILFVDDFHHHWPQIREQVIENRIPFIGVSTPHDFERVVSTDGSRFEQVFLGEPGEDETVRMVAARAQLLEEHYGISISNEALEAAVRLPHRYLFDSRLPEKAFNTLHQACVASLTSHSELTPETVAEVVASNARLPLDRITLRAGQGIARIRADLEETIVGQEQAIQTVCETLTRAHQGLSAQNRPDAVFLLLGPTGVGKTELAKRVGHSLVGENRFFHFDMSDYGSAHEASRLTGAPPGYVGHERGGRLSDLVRANPYCVLLFDEIEKAHPQVLDLFLQIFDEGRLVDNLGRRIDFQHTTIFLTSNLGAGNPTEIGLRHRANDDDHAIIRAAKKSLRPELWNRIDEVVVFHPLNQESVRKIAEKLVAGWDHRLRVLRNVGISLTPAALDLLVERGYSNEMGAREMRRTVEREVTGLIGRRLEYDSVAAGTVLEVDAVQEKLVVR